MDKEKVMETADALLDAIAEHARRGPNVAAVHQLAQAYAFVVDAGPRPRERGSEGRRASVS